MLAAVLLAPTLLILLLFIAYPFALGLWLAVTDKVVGRPGNFIGLENFRVNLNDAIFLRAFRNTFVYTFIATFLKLALGMAAALLLNHHFKFKRIVRAGMLLPWIVPTVLSTLAWQWMFDATFSVINWVLRWLWQREIQVFGVLLKENWGYFRGPQWLGDPVWEDEWYDRQ